jgi:cytolysin-activating lysine-acyltransferase
MSDSKIEMMQQLEQARSSLAKLPLLGPAAWLFGRDELKRFTFMADIDWLLLPPLVLDQCKLYSKQEIPWAFFTWAFVNDSVHARLQSAEAKIAPHEWKSGQHPWIISAIAPFGDMESLLADVCKSSLAGKTVNAFVPGLNGQTVIRVIKP